MKPDLMRELINGIGEALIEALPPVTVDQFLPYLNYFDDRQFEVGTFVTIRDDAETTDKGGIVNLRWPRKGEPALVVDNIQPFTGRDSGEYERDTMIILVLDGTIPRRISVDPVHFQKYELPGERMLREIDEETKEVKDE